jgi:hypothetical protein
MDKVKLAEAVLGKQTEEFISSDVGKVLLGMAEQDAKMAMQELKKCHPWRWRKIRDLQNRIKWAESFEGWLLDLVHTGRIATKTLEMEEYDD